jgi:hypothetical protein
MISADPNGKTLLKGSNLSGAGGTSSSGKPGGRNPWLKDSFSRSEQHILIRSNPDLAKQMAKEANVDLQF